jgi:hypothetical protein
MKVDMSPEAISSRLELMGQLWELSVALADSEFVDGARRRPRRHRVAAIQDSIRKVLMDQWDPIGVRGVPEAVDEYDPYIGRIYRILSEGESTAEVADLLASVEREEIGVSTSPEVRSHVAAKLLDLQAAFGKDFL